MTGMKIGDEINGAKRIGDDSGHKELGIQGVLGSREAK